MINIFVSLLIFLAPINLFLKFFEQDAYVGGIFVDYFVVKIYLVEAAVLGFLLWWLIKNNIWKKILSKKKTNIKFFKKNIYLLFFVLILLIKQFFTPKPMVAFWQLARFLEFGLLGFFLWSEKEKISKKVVRWSLLATIIFQSVLGIVQFYQQKPVLPYRFLGETQFTRSINVSRIQFATSQKIPPHGTTAHPNILAGMLVIYGIILLENLNRDKEKAGLILVVLISLMIFLTQSYSAILALSFYLIAKTFKKTKIVNWLKKNQWKIFVSAVLIIPLMMGLGQKYFLLNDTSLTRRVELNKQAVQIFSQKPLLGAGFGQFTNFINQRGGEIIRFIQPVHGVILLWATETGLVGIILAIVFLKKYLVKFLKYPWIFALIPIVTLDHYLLTQWVGLWLVLMLTASALEHRLE